MLIIGRPSVECAELSVQRGWPSRRVTPNKRAEMAAAVSSTERVTCEYTPSAAAAE